MWESIEIIEENFLTLKKNYFIDEMVREHHQLNGHEFEQTPEDSEGQGSLACCSPRGPKESDTT